MDPKQKEQDKEHETLHDMHEEDEEDDHQHNENLQCRFYRKDFPDEGDLVIVTISYLS